MPILDALIGKSSIDRQREIADEAAFNRFDPDQFLPQLEEAQRQSQEGIVDEPIREQFLSQIFSQKQPDQQDIGTGSGRFLSMMQENNQGSQEAIADFETKLGLQEEGAKREGRMRASEIMGQRRQIESQREAKLAENRLMAEAEADRRRKQFGSAIGKLAGTVAGTAFGPLGAAVGGAAGGALFGGGQGAVAGGLTGALTSADLGRGEETPRDNFSIDGSVADTFSNLGPTETLDFMQSLSGQPQQEDDILAKIRELLQE